MYFGFEIYSNDRRKTPPVADSSEVLPLTYALEAPANQVGRLIKRPNNVTETRSHRYIGDRYMGFRNYKNFRGQFFMKQDDRAVFDVKVSTDEHGRRCNNDDCLQPVKNCGQVLIFASSKIFGYGIKNNETLPAQLAGQFPNFSVYNYGVVAGNYFQMLVQAKSGELKKGLSDAPTSVIFFWEPDGFKRTYPSVGTPYILEQPCFEMNTQTQRLEYKGNFMSCKPFRSQLIWNLSLSDSFSKNFPDLDFTSYEQKVEEVRNIFNETKKELNEQFPSSVFVLAAIEHNESDENIKELAYIAEGLDIPVLNFNIKEAKLKFKSEGKQVEVDPYDRHPSAFIYQYLAEQMKTPLMPILKQINNNENCYQ